MAMQTAGNGLVQISGAPSRSGRSGAPALILAVTSVLAVVAALSLVGQLYAGVGAAPPGFDDSRAWIVGP